MLLCEAAKRVGGAGLAGNRRRGRRREHKISDFSIPLVSGDGGWYGALNSDASVLAASNNEGFIYLESGEKIGEIHLPYRFKV